MKIIILERDGVINQVMGDITTDANWTPIPGALEAIASLNQAGYRVVIAMNYPEDGPGGFDLDSANKIQHTMHRSLEQVGGQLDAIFFCSHKETDHCICRLPKPGMIHDIADRYHSELSELTLIGCSRESIQAAVTSGIRTILLRNKHLTTAGINVSGLSYTATFNNLVNAANALISLDLINQK